MRVLGIDPGSHRIGWGIISTKGTEQKAMEFGCIELPPHTDSATYLQTIYDSIKQILTQHPIDAAGIEKIFFQKNLKTATTVAQSRGVILLALAQHNISVVELSPNTIKLAVAGSGRATKKQVESMVVRLLDLDQAPKLDDTTDALATAITTSTMRIPT